MGKRKGHKVKGPDVDFLDELAKMCVVHFPGWNLRVRPIEELTCAACQDKRIGFCRGSNLKGDQVLDCMAQKVLFGEEVRVSVLKSA